MEVRIKLVPSLESKHGLSLDQKQALRKLLSLRLALRDHKIPNPKKGLEGLIASDELLKKRNSTGLLIGSLSESVWNKNRTPTQLSQYKDTDVLVLTDGFVPNENFENGIDWWLPRTERLRISYGHGHLERLQKWWENANGTVLSFDVLQKYSLPSGLYIPSNEFVVEMRLAEARSNIDLGIVRFDYDNVFKALENRIKERVYTRLPKFIAERFENQVLDEDYTKNFEYINAIGINGLDIDIVSEIKHKAKTAEK